MSDTYIKTAIETATDELNEIIKKYQVPIGAISDGYHTFDELYEHRITLYIALCSQLARQHRLIEIMSEQTNITEGLDRSYIWKSEVHSDGTIWNGWFILGINTLLGHQITYHLPTSKWDECDFAKVIDKAPEWDGHTPADVLERLKQL